MAQHLLDRERGRVGGRGEGVALGELPQPPVQAVGAAPREQDRAAPLDPQRDPREHRQRRDALARRHPRQLLLAAGRAGAAGAGERAGEAARRARRAHGRAELHQALVEIARRGAGGQRLDDRAGERPDRALAARRLDVLLDGEHAREHARDVAVDQRRALAVRDRRDRAGGVRADAGDVAQPGGGRRQRARPARDDLARAAVQVARARVVAEAGPGGEDVVERRVGEGPHRREARHPALPVRDHRRDAGLLQHDLADPDRVGIARATPGQVASGAAVVGDDGGGDGGGVGGGHEAGARYAVGTEVSHGSRSHHDVARGRTGRGR